MNSSEDTSSLNYSVEVNDTDTLSNRRNELYFDIAFRAETILKKPTRVTALVIGVLAITMNGLSLVVVSRALRRAKRQAAHFGFIISLAASDMLFALSVISVIVNQVVNPLYQPGVGPETARLYSRCAFVLLKAINTIALNAELLSLMGMAIDHYIAILKPLHYASLMHKKCYIIIILVFWAIAFICGMSDFLYVVHDLRDWEKWKFKYNLCEFVYVSTYQEEYTTFVTAGLCLVTMVFTYSRIYMVVCTHENSNIHRSGKALRTTLLIVGTFLLCWLPTCIFQVALVIQVRINPRRVNNLITSLMKADQHLYNLLLLNTLFDPIIYAVRIPELRMGYISLFSRKKKFEIWSRGRLGSRESPTKLTEMWPSFRSSNRSQRSNSSKKQLLNRGSSINSDMHSEA